MVMVNNCKLNKHRVRVKERSVFINRSRANSYINYVQLST